MGHYRQDAASLADNWTLVGLVLSLVIPSAGLFWKYFGVPGVAIYAVGASLLLLVGRRAFFPWIMRRLDGRDLWLALATLLLVCIFVALLYPIANSGIVGGGSDRDDMVDLAVGELLHGRYPYYTMTYLGNPISLLPGALILASPFVLLGIGPYQSLFWLAVFFLVLRGRLPERQRGLLLVWLGLFLSPVAANELATGSDLLANSLYVLVFMAWFVSVAPRSDCPWWHKLASALLLGIGLSSRSNFIVLLPLAYALIARAGGWRRALLWTGVVCIALVAVTIPFFLHAPAQFTPLTTQDKFEQFEELLPGACWILPAATAVFAAVLALRTATGDLWALLRRSTAVLAFPVLCAIVLGSVRAGSLDLRFAFYGVAFLFYGVAGFWQGTVRPPAQDDESQGANQTSASTGNQPCAS